MKTLKRIFLSIVLTVLLLPAGLFLALQIPRVQTACIRSITDKASRMLNVEIGMGKAYISFFNKMVLTDLSVIIPPSDTLFAAKKIALSLSRFNPLAKTAALGRLDIEDGGFYLVVDSACTNVERLFAPDSSGKKGGSPHFDWTLSLSHLEMKNFCYGMKIPFKHPIHHNPKSIDFSDFFIKDLNIDIRNLRFDSTGLTAELRKLSGNEKCGYRIKNISGKATVNGRYAALEDMTVEDSYSRITAHSFYMRYGNAANLKYYTEKVAMELDLDRALLDFRTLGYFIHSMKEIPFACYLNGKARGTVKSLHADALNILTKSGKTHLDLGFDLHGLPIARNTTLFIDIDSLDTRAGELSAILEAFGQNPARDILLRAGPQAKIGFKGRMAGLLADLVVNGRLRSDFGQIYADALVKYDRGLQIDGEIGTRDLDLGILSGNTALGKISLYTRAGLSMETARGSSLQARIDSLSIGELEFNNYTYGHIRAKGSYENGELYGSLSAHDPALELLLRGRARLRAGGADRVILPQDYDFFARIVKADLFAMGLNRTDSVSLLSGIIKARDSCLTGTDNRTGYIDAEDFIYKKGKVSHRLGAFRLSFSLNDSLSTIKLDSDFADADYRGGLSPMQFAADCRSRVLCRHLPALFRKSANPGEAAAATSTATSAASAALVPAGAAASAAAAAASTPASASVRLSFLNTDFFEALLLPDLYIAPKTEIKVDYTAGGQMQVRVSSDRLGYNRHNVKDLDININSSPLGIQSRLQAASLHLGGILLDYPAIHLGIADNRARLSFTCTDTSQMRKLADFNLLSRINAPDDMELDLQESYMELSEKTWRFTSSQIKIKQKAFDIDSFRLCCRGQSLLLDGRVSPDPADTLVMQLNDFDISLFNMFAKDFAFSGSLTGGGELTDPYGSPRLSANITGNDISVNGSPLGRIDLLSDWDRPSGRLRMELCSLTDEGVKPITLSGYYEPATKRLSIDADCDRFPLSLAEPFLEGIISEMEGGLSGQISLSGRMPKPILSGKGVRIEDLGFTVDYTEVHYTLNAPVELRREGVYLPEGQLTDRFGNRGRIKKGWLYYNDFRNLGFDLEIRFDNLQVIAISPLQNDIFYGNAFGTGEYALKGDLSDMRMYLSARTEKNSVTKKNSDIHIPIANTSEVKSTDLLSFVQPVILHEDPYARETKKKKKNGNTKISLDIKVEATPDAELSLEIDNATGNTIHTVGNGQINMEVNAWRDLFTIKGDYTVKEGDYVFPLQGILTKKFKIENGGTMHFVGDIMKTRLDLTATYNTKASLNTLLADTSALSKRHNTACQIRISDELSNPRLDFNIEVEDIDPIIEARVDAALNTEDKRMKQFMTLFISDHFLPDFESGIVYNSNILYSNVTEILSNQLNAILAQLDIPLDVAFNYQPGTRGRDIFDLAISTQLFNNRVIVNGNVGNSPYHNSPNSIVGDVDIEFKIDDKGKYRLKGFSHSADQYSNYLDNTQRNGLGFVYQEEFNTFKELWNRLFKSKKKRQGKAAGPD